MTKRGESNKSRFLEFFANIGDDIVMLIQGLFAFIADILE